MFPEERAGATVVKGGARSAESTMQVEEPWMAGRGRGARWEEEAVRAERLPSSRRTEGSAREDYQCNPSCGSSQYSASAPNGSTENTGMSLAQHYWSTLSKGRQASAPS